MSILTRRVQAIALATALIGATPQAFAFADVVEGVTYTLRCAGLMLSDSAAHVAQCNPKFPPPQLNSLIEGSNNARPVAPAPAAPAVVPVDDGCDEPLGGFLSVEKTVLVASLDMLVAEVDDCGEPGGGEVLL